MDKAGSAEDDLFGGQIYTINRHRRAVGVHLERKVERNLESSAANRITGPGIAGAGGRADLNEASQFGRTIRAPDPQRPGRAHVDQ